MNAILTPQMREENPDKPFQTFTSAEDIAEAIAYLISDAAAKMNGASGSSYTTSRRAPAAAPSARPDT